MSHGQQHHHQQQQQQQPTQSDYYFDFNDHLDFSTLPDMGEGGAPQQLPADGTDGLDMSTAAAAAAFFGNPFLPAGGTFDAMPMSLDTDDAAVVNDPSAFFPSFSAAPVPLIHPLAPPISQVPLAPQDADTVIQDSFPQDNPPPSTAPTVVGPTVASIPAPALASAAPAGPLSTGGAAAPSATSDFTKRRNWPAKVIEEMRDLLQILDGDGRIKYVSPSITALAGYTQQELTNEFLRDHIHPDDVGVFLADMNESIASGEPMRIFHRLRKKDGQYAIFETTGHAHVAPPRFAPNPNNRSPFCQAVFMISRPYPTRNAGLLDTFLEHKVENDRLRRRIAELREEEETEEAEAQRQWRQRRGSRSELSRSEDGRTRASSMASGTMGGAGYDGSMAPPRGPTMSGALTRENLEGAVAGSRPDSLRDKMARYEGGAGTRAETIEMLTGRRYVDGDQRIGFGQAGAASGPGGNGGGGGRGSTTLITGDAGIAIPVGRDNRSGEKKKKQKLVEEYVCTDCGTLESPEWRKGPNGPKTLCNACGLRWAKKEKKRQMTGANAAHATTRDQHMTGS